jgi:hypothetical protein
MNTKDGGSQLLRIEAPWTFADDPSADVAVLPWAPDATVFSYRFLSTDMFAGPEVRETHGIGPGDEVFMTGLFTQHHGRKRNLPIVRSGIIAAMPQEPIPDDETGLEYPAYIIEARSIGGLSGSPVFVRLSVGRVFKKTINLRHDRLYLLGLIRGHWDQKKQSPTFAFAESELEAVNMGMALVVPSDDILAALNNEVLSERREARDKKRAAERAPTNDLKPAES